MNPPLINILVLEDNDDDFMLFENLLESGSGSPVRVLHATRLEKALETARRQVVDVAVIDLNLPDSFGMETLTMFRDKFPLIPVIVMTGAKEAELGIQALHQGAQDFIEKGALSAASVHRTIRYAIERQRLISELSDAKTTLQQSLEKSKRREKGIHSLLQGARAVLRQRDFQTTARQVFGICSDLIGSTSGYVALLSEDGMENEVLFLESGNRPCSVDPNLPMPIRWLRETAYRDNQTVYDNDFMNSEWMAFMPSGHVELTNVMFAPLVIDNKTVGIMGLANKPDDFNLNDAKLASGFGELAAIALQNSRNLDQRDAAEKANQNLIVELKDAVQNVKKLSGLIPICSFCKKIRDDKGYWEQIELYIDQHSEASFSHSICEECAGRHYPGMNIYEDD